MTLGEKSSKELATLTMQVAERFFKAKNALILLDGGNLLSDSDRPYALYLFKVNRAYRSLDEEEKNLINNEFFFQNYQTWWIGLYSKAYFYRFKRKAMLKFLEAFYHG